MNKKNKNVVIIIGQMKSSYATFKNYNCIICSKLLFKII